MDNTVVREEALENAGNAVGGLVGSHKKLIEVIDEAIGSLSSLSDAHDGFLASCISSLSDQIDRVNEFNDQIQRLGDEALLSSNVYKDINNSSKEGSGSGGSGMNNYEKKKQMGEDSKLDKDLITFKYDSDSDKWKIMLVEKKLGSIKASVFSKFLKTETTLDNNKIYKFSDLKEDITLDDIMSVSEEREQENKQENNKIDDNNVLSFVNNLNN